MGKDPSFPWYPNDFDRDLHACHSSTAGIWARLLNEMWWKNPRGRIRAPRESFPLLCGCTKEEFDIFLRENKTFGFADVKVRNGFVTVINRRMYRTDIARKKGKERVEKHRRNKEEMEVKRDCNLNVQAETPPPSSSSSSSSSSSKKEGGREENFLPSFQKLRINAKEIKGWVFSQQQDIDFFAHLLPDYSEDLILKVIEDLRVYQEKPTKFYKNLHAALRNWCANEKKWKGESEDKPQVPLDKYGNPYYTVDGENILEIDWRELMDKDAIEPNKDGTWKRILRGRND